MKRPAHLVTVLVLLILAGCSSMTTGMFGTVTEGPENTVQVSRLPSLRVVGLVVTVPRSLVSTESNAFKPVGDIVWREDAFGDRHSQVQTIVEDAISAGVAPLQGNLPVVLHIEITRFHALTERTRYSVGGVQEISFLLTVTNGQTGEVIVPAYQVDASLPAFGGARALAAERVGQTQKVRISDHLARLIQLELTGVPGSDPAS